jgi:phosphatidylglycerol lysyltransferase
MSGGSVRYRNYSALGLSALEVAGIIGMGTLTFALGVATLLGISLWAMSGRAQTLLHRSSFEVHALGTILLSGVAAYLLLTLFRRRPIKLFGRSLPLPPAWVALRQVVVATVDLCFAAGSLYVLLRGHLPLHYTAFIGIFALAIQAGVLSNVPGGALVFETVLMSMLPISDTQKEFAVAAVIVYRFIYYLVPFGLAITLLAGRELFAGRHLLRGATITLRRWVELVAPQVLSFAVFAAGAVLLFSGATPEIDSRMEWLRDVVPLPVLEISHIAGSAIGVGLLILARGLYQRLDAAWWVTMLLLAVGIAASLLKGFDYEEATLLGILMLLLALSAARFYRRAPLLEQPFSLGWMLCIALVLGLAVWIAKICYSDVPYEHDLWWQFAFDSQAPRVMRAGLISILIASAYALRTLLSPTHPEMPPPTTEEVDRAMTIVAKGPETLPNLVALGDKPILFDDSGDAFIMFQRSGRSMIAMGDPVGDPKRFPELVWKYRELCDRSARWPVFYQVSKDNLPLYLDLGLSLAKLGEEARVYLPDFSLQGSKRADLRNEHRRALREGVRFAVMPPVETAINIRALHKVSDAWLLEKAAAEKGFSVGRFDEAYVRRFAQACVYRGEQLVAFATLWQSPAFGELSIDLMRYGEGAPRGVMDYLFIELMLWAKAENFRWFNLGMAPLKGLEGHPLAPFWHKLGSMVRHYGRTLYNFEGLRRYKEKFSPEWRPRYLASPGGLILPRVALDSAALIAGGIREVVTK